MTTRVLKWDVSVDDQVHFIGRGPIVHIACQNRSDRVQIWTEEGDVPEVTRLVIVVGTGHSYPPNVIADESGHWHAVGTALTNIGLVWHVLNFIPCRGGCEPGGYIKGTFNTCTREEEHAG